MKFEIIATDEFITGRAGLALVGQLLKRTKLRARLNDVHLPENKAPEISHADNLFSMIGLLCMAKPDYDAIEEFREDDFFADTLGVAKVPSSPTLRQRFDMAEGRFDRIIVEESARLLKGVDVTLTPCHNKHPVLDIDVCCFDNSDTKKEGVSRTYKGFNGYAPVFVYPAEEGYLVNARLKEGKDHCRNGMPEFLDEALCYARLVTRAPLLVRLDSGNDSADNLKICAGRKADWIIKRNLRNENPDEWLFTAITGGKERRPRDGKKVWTGETRLEIGGQETLRIGLAPTRKKVARRRIRSVIQEMIYMACRMVRHARRVSLKFARRGAWFPAWSRVYARFAAT